MKIPFFKLALLSQLTFAPFMLSSQTPTPIKLYPNISSSSNFESEKFDGRTIQGVVDPAIYIFSPDKLKNTGMAVVICPGGGYKHEAIIHEGFQVAEWLASEGITGIVLKYRLPNGQKEIPLEDVKQTFQLVHEKSDSLGINPNKIGIAGFSAGGHLAATAGTFIKGPQRPDFMILFYPVISMTDSLTHKGSRTNLLGNNYSVIDKELYSTEKQVSEDTPPTLLLLSDDDKSVNPLNSILFYKALKKNNIKSSMFIFSHGGHGWGYNTNFTYHESWKKLTLDWLRDI